MLRRLAILTAMVASLSGCQAAVYGAISFGMTTLSDAFGITAAIKANMRAASGQCVSETFKTIPCPPAPTVKP